MIMSKNSNFDVEKLKNIILQFKIPLVFDVQNSMQKEDAGEPFMIVLNGIPAKLHLERIYDFRYKEEFNIAPFSKMEEDRGCILSYSRVQVWFDKQILISERIDINTVKIWSDQFIDLAIEYINKFVRIYKEITQDFWLRHIVKKDVFDYRYILVDENGNHEQTTTFIPLHHIIQFNGGKEFTLEENQVKALRALLVSDFFNLRNELIMHMLDNFSLGYYNVALIQANTIFENYVYSQLKNKLSKTKLNKIKKKEKCGCLVGISEVCERGIKEYFGIDFSNTSEFRSLKKNALRYRNLIVHGELLKNIDKETCEKGIKAIKAAEDYLSDNVFD